MIDFIQKTRKQYFRSASGFKFQRREKDESKLSIQSRHQVKLQGEKDARNNYLRILDQCICRLQDGEIILQGVLKRFVNGKPKFHIYCLSIDKVTDLFAQSQTRIWHRDQLKRLKLQFICQTPGFAGSFSLAKAIDFKKFVEVMALEDNFYYKRFLLFQKFQKWHYNTIIRQLPVYLSLEGEKVVFEKRSQEDLKRF